MGFLSSVGDFIGGAVKTVGKVVGGSVGGLVGTGLNYLLSSEQADDAYDQSRSASAEAYARDLDLYKKRYQYTTADMKKAGINPILAASGGFNIGSSPTFQPAQAFLPSNNLDVTSSALNVANTGKANAEIKKIDEEADKIHNEINKILSEVVKTDSENRQIAVGIKKTLLEYQKLGEEITSVELSNERNKILTKYMRKLEDRLDQLISGTDFVQDKVQGRLKTLWDTLKDDVNQIIKMYRSSGGASGEW